MSGPDREVSASASCAEPPPAPLTAAAAAASSPPGINDTTSLSTSPSPSVVAQHQHQQPFQPHHQLQQTAASEAAAASTSALLGQQEHHHNPNLSHDESTSTDNIPPFEPIFTLLTNNTTNTTVHPRVHYLFSDDDASAVLTAPQTDPSHRALIVDLAPPAAPNGKWTVSWASSLTPDFAVTASQLSLQQHGSGGGGGSSGGAGGGDGETEAEAASTSVMLRVEGVEREAVVDTTKPNNSLPSSSSGIVGREDVEHLTEEFRRRMGVLRKVVDEGERRRETLSRLNEETPHDDGGGEDATAAAVEDDTSGKKELERQDE
ncbi:hypothetical protein ACHAQJ_009541 [Trichoderma viride]